MDAHDSERQSLMQKLLDSVKQCQVDFGGKTTLATDKDSSVSCFVNHFELALQHGLKKNKVWEKITSISEPFRQVTQRMLPEIDITFWSLVKEHLGSLDLQHFQTLEGITTEAGRARVWLRLAINECSLERHLNTFLANVALLRYFYEPWALLLDEERASTLPIMAQGLNSILFAIDTKNQELNQPFKNVAVPHVSLKSTKTHRRVNSSPLPIMAGFDTEPSIVKKIASKKKKKRKVMEATINDLDETPACSSSYGDKHNNINDMNIYSTSCGALSINQDANSRTNGKGRNIMSAPTSPFVNMSSNADNFKYASADTFDDKSLSSKLEYLEKNTDEKKTIHSNDANIELTNNLNKVASDNDLCANSCKINFNPVKYANSNVSSFGERIHAPPVTPQTPATPHSINLNDSQTAHMLTNVGDSLSQYLTNQNKTHLEQVNNDTEKEDISVTSSNSDLCIDELNAMCTLGSDNSKYVQLFMTYDQESSQAATDTLALLTASTGNEVFDIPPQQELPDTTSNSNDSHLDKYIPKLSTQVNENKDLSSVDLKHAILATAKKKDEVEERNRVLKVALEEQRESIHQLRSEHDELQILFHEKNEANNRKIQELSRENEVLKNQLKKYVATVQMLRKDIVSEETKEVVNNLRVPAEDIIIPPKPKERTISENDSIFEDKLAQMAEMHGELMEFQESLQRELVVRENRITRMKQELVSLRGPLPRELERPTNTPFNSSESLYSPNRMLINIWIPSVFLKGKGTDAHHLYQIYIRIGDEEWNIYRRYSQFNKLHLQMCKVYTVLEKFSFPKKKMFGKKDITFVEQRRRKLQEYLRILINHCIADNSELSADTSKNKLLNVLPFFGEQFVGDDDKKKKKSKNEKKSPQYTGL